jgi:hypothetical protein
MKRLLHILLLLFLFSGLKVTAAGESWQLPDAVTRDFNRLDIGTSPQVELISIVQAISKYPEVFDFLMAKDSSEYKSEVLEYFSLYRDHPVVQMLNRLSMQPGMLNFSAPSNILLLADRNLDLRSDLVTDDFVIKRAGGMDSLVKFLDLLKDFAVKSSFDSFYNAHSNFYQEIAEHVIRNLGQINYINELENFYGQTQHSYNIVLVPLYGHVGFGNSLLLPDGKRELYCTIGPRGVSGNIPFFGDEDYLKYLIRHEFSHPFVNPLTEKYWDRIREYSRNYPAIPEIAKKSVCGDWQECINEFIIRAVTTQLSYDESEKLGSEVYQKEKSHGVSYLDTVLISLRVYEAKRDKYQTFESFYPILLNTFKN